MANDETTEEREFDFELIGQRGFILDGHNFINAKVDNNVLFYLGGPVPRFVDCALTNNTFAFQGAASNTMQFFGELVQHFPKAERESWLKGYGLLAEHEHIATGEADDSAIE